MKEKNKKQPKQNNIDVQAQEELTDEALNEVSGGAGSQIQVGSSIFSKISIFRRNNINPNFVVPSCW